MFNLGLLSDAALTGLSDAEKESMQKQATQQFLIGSLLSGDPATGFKSASEIPSTSLNMQKMIRDSQVAQQQQQELAGFKQKYAPTPMQAGQQSFVNAPTRTSTDYGPSPQAAQRQIDRLNAPIDYNQALIDSLRLSGNPAQPQIRETLTAMQPKLQDGYIVGPGGKIIGFAPKVDTKAGTVTTGTMLDGQPQFQTGAIGGFRSATALNTLPELTKGEEYLFDANGQVAGVRNAAGTLNALAERTRTETGAREANIPRPSTTEAGAPSFTFVTPPAMQGQGGAVAQPITGPSTAQATLNAAFKPILDDAYKGYQTAKKTAPVIDQLQNAYNSPGFDTGSFTNVRTQLGNVFNSLGVSGERNKQFLTNAISARQGINALTGESLSEAVGAISNFEIGYYGQRNAQITDPKESTNFNLAVLREANKRKQEYYNFVSDPKNAGPEAIRKWEASPQGQRGMFEAPGLRKYLPQFQVTAGPDKGKTAYQLPNGSYRVYD
jgi:hypothetical protein